MYKLSPEPKYTYNTTFMLEFEQQECIQYDKSYPDIIKSWWGHPEKFRADAHGMYAMASLDTHMIYVAMMLCRLFRKKSPTHFPVEWVSIMHEVAKGYTFNWAKILSDNLAKEITEYKMVKSKGQPTPFYMSTYVMDAICFLTPFPLMNWSWTPTSAEPIHFYHSKLWEEKAKDLFYEICHNVVVPVHVALYGHPPPHISDRIMGNLEKLVDWFIEENFSYIRVFRCSVPPHALPNIFTRPSGMPRSILPDSNGGHQQGAERWLKKRYGLPSLSRSVCFFYWISVTQKWRPHLCNVPQIYQIIKKKLRDIKTPFSSNNLSSKTYNYYK
jgi:hypothetical protein